MNPDRTEDVRRGKVIEEREGWAVWNKVTSIYPCDAKRELKTV